MVAEKENRSGNKEGPAQARWFSIPEFEVLEAVPPWI